MNTILNRIASIILGATLGIAMSAPALADSAITPPGVPAGYVDYASGAGYATSSGYATNSGYAGSAGYATSAGYAGSAGYATSAGSAPGGGWTYLGSGPYGFTWTNTTGRNAMVFLTAGRINYGTPEKNQTVMIPPGAVATFSPGQVEYQSGNELGYAYVSY